MKGPDRGRPVKKPSGFMSNSIEIRHALSRVCEGRNGECSRPQGGKHTTVQGSVTKSTAIYPRELCRAVLRGMTAQLRRDRRLIAGCYGIQVEDAGLDPVSVDKETDGVMHGHLLALAAEVKGEDAMAERQLFGPAQGYSGKYKDDLTGQPLRDDLVKMARAKELEFFCSKGVWIKVPRRRSFEKIGKPPISVRWVDVNKGDEMEPNYRSSSLPGS